MRALRLAIFSVPLLCLTAWGQSTTTQTAPASDPIVVREVDPQPSYQDLKYPKLPEVKIPSPVTFTLPNGLKVYLLENHELPLVTGRMLVRTGNLFDPKDKLGLAEITGMLMRSGGTAKLSGDDLDEKLENMAASVETAIGESDGQANFSCLKENTDAVLSAFHDVVTEPAFRQDKLQLAKTQIASSISRRNDDASGISQRELYRIVYGRDTPYGGQEEYDTIAAVKREDVMAFYKRYFFPSNSILAIYGDFDSGALRTKLTTLFGDWKNDQAKVPPFPKVDATVKPGIYLVPRKDVTQTFINMGHLGGELRDKDFAALSVAADVYGGGFSSRLFREVRTRLGYAYSVGAMWGATYDHPGVFTINVSTKTATTTETVATILKALDELRSKEISDEELKVSKDSVLNSLVFAFERPSSTLNRLVTYDYYGYPADFLSRYQKAIEAVTKADVLRVATEYFQPAKLAIVAVGNPEKFGKALTDLHLPITPLDVSIPPPTRTGGAGGPSGGMANTTAAAGATREAKAAVPAKAAVVATPANSSRGKVLAGKALAFAGGADNLRGLKDLTQVQEATMTTPQGEMKMAVTAKTILPATFRQEQQRGRGAITLYVSPTEAWVHTPMGIQDVPMEAQAQLRGQANKQITAILMQLLKHHEEALGTATNQFQMKLDSGDEVTIGLQASGAIETISFEDSSGPVVEKYSDWRSVGNGLKFPFHYETVKNGKTVQTATTSQFQVNTNLKPEELSKRP